MAFLKWPQPRKRWRAERAEGCHVSSTLMFFAVDQYDSAFFLRAATPEQKNDVLALFADSADVRHHWVPCSLSFSLRLNKRRTTSITVVASASLAAVFSVVIGVCMTLLMMPRVRASTAIS